MTTIHHLYDQLAEFIAQANTKMILDYKVGKDLDARFSALVAKKRSNTITGVERSELEQFFVLERLMQLAKVKAAVKMKASE